MDDDVERVPLTRKLVVHVLNLRVVLDVGAKHAGSRDLLGTVPHHLLDTFVLVGDRKRRAFAMQRLGDAPRDAALVGHAPYNGSLAVQQSHGWLLPPSRTRIEPTFPEQCQR